MTDEFSNPLSAWAGGQSPLEATEYPLTRMTENYALLNSLYRTNWIVQNVVSIVPEDMTQEWFILSGADISPEMQAEFEQQRVTQLKAKVTDGLRWGAALWRRHWADPHSWAGGHHGPTTGS